MFRRPKGKKLGTGIARGYDHRAPVAKVSISDVDKLGRRTLLERRLEYNAGEPSRKRARTEDTVAQDIEEESTFFSEDQSPPDAGDGGPDAPSGDPPGRSKAGKDTSQKKVRNTTSQCIYLLMVFH